MLIACIPVVLASTAWAAVPSRSATREASSAKNVVNNGDFTHPDAATGQRGTNNVGYFTEYCIHADINKYCPKTSEHFGSWTVAKGSVDLLASSYFTPPAHAPSGTQSVDLDGIHSGAIEQRISTTKTRRYALSFEFAGNPNGDVNAASKRPVKHLRILVSGHTLHNYSVNVTGRTQSAPGWKHEHLIFKAPSAATTLEFDSTDAAGSDAGPLVTQITVGRS